MKYNKQMLCVMLLCVCLALSGCGSLYEMTESEENQIVLYSAKIVSKYNRAQEKGYSYVNEETKASAQEETADPSDTEEPTQENVDESVTLTEAMGLDGVLFTYQGYDVTTTYQTSDIAIPDAGAGYVYVLLHIQLANTSGQDMMIDLINHPVTYQLCVNGDVTVEGLTTLSMADLSTYYNKAFAAGTTDDTVLLFQVSENVASQISDLMLQVTKDGQTNLVRL